MHYFCTLFDSNYFSRGLVMYESLKNNISNFHLYIFAFDDLSYNKLLDLNLDKVTVISLTEFEDEELLKIKKTRDAREYCWTCTSSTVLYSIEKFNLPECTYLDADLYFFSSPEPIFTEMGDNSVLITEHRFSEQYKDNEISGKYNVQFVVFKNNPTGLQVLKSWRKECINWCYARVENGKFGDQKYLDYWQDNYKGIHILKNLGGGVAPWNVNQYDIYEKENKIYGCEKSSDKKFELIFYHFHNYKIFNEGFVKLSDYELSKQILSFIYQKYTENIIDMGKYLSSKNISFNPHNLQKSQNKYDIVFIINKNNMNNYNGDNIIIYDKKKFNSKFLFYKLTYNLQIKLKILKKYFNIFNYIRFIKNRFKK